jgi:prolyl-tRNA synthetase
VSTRMVGGLIMAHGDDSGLRLPPRAAPVQAVVLLVKADGGAGERAAALAAELLGAGVRAQLDERVDTSFGRRAVDWELKGVPLRIEVGPRDLEQGVATVVRRDTGDKTPVPIDEVVGRVPALLEEIQRSLHDEALERRESRTVDVETVAEAAEAAATGFARLPWSAVGDAGEDELARSSVTVRCLQRPDGSLPGAEDDPDLVAVVARAY